MKKFTGPIDENLTLAQRVDLLASRVIRLESRLEQCERQTKPPPDDRRRGAEILKAMASMEESK